MIFAGGVVNPPVSFADSPLYTRGPLTSPNTNLPYCCINPIYFILFSDFRKNPLQKEGESV